jgi:putative membrane protein
LAALRAICPVVIVGERGDRGCRVTARLRSSSGGPAFTVQAGAVYRATVALRPMPVSHPVIRFLLFWGVNTLSLWVADEIFGGIRFETAQSLFISGLLLGLANTFVKPVLLVLTFPITVITFGLFVLILNAFVLFMIAWLVPGFLLAGFWSGAMIALFVSILSFLVNRALGLNTVVVTRTR